jgi:hypothetical protein
MKKIALICLALVIALGGLGVASALWWDWLYIDAWVETGDIGVEWSLEGFGDNEIKDVSEVYAWISGPVLYVDIYNAYPCVTYWVHWDMVCTGTVPVHFAGPFISGNLPPGEITFTDMDFNPIDWYAVQLHEGDRIEGLLTIHLDNTAEQNALYSFYIDLYYHQYNESF